jgi:ribonuclease P protein component
MAAPANSREVDARYQKDDRLRRGEDFSATFKEGLWGRNDVVRIVIRRRQGGGRSRFGMAVSKKFGKAHKRNGFKRRLREVVRTTKGELPAGFDCVILPSNRSPNPSYEILLSSLPELIRKTVSRLNAGPKKDRKKYGRRRR